MRKLGKLLLLTFLISGLLTLPALSQDTGREAKFKGYRQKLAKELKLSPDQEKAYTALSDQFMKQRMDLYAELNKEMANLKQALAAQPLDEAKIKTAVAAVTAVKEKLWQNYQDWWHGEMQLLNPVQQGKYLVTVEKWWKGVMAGRGERGAARQD